jgi:hypothetical protein
MKAPLAESRFGARGVGRGRHKNESRERSPETKEDGGAGVRRVVRWKLRQHNKIPNLKRKDEKGTWAEFDSKHRRKKLE